MIIAAILIVTLSGCGADSSPPVPKSELPSLSIGVSQPVSTLNPVTMGTEEESNLANFVWAGLLGVNASGWPFPMLAQSVPSYGNGLITANGLSITFVLKSNLHWSDGTPITATDVRFGWQLATQVWADVCAATCWSIRNVAVDSPSRVTFQLSQPYSPLLFDLPPVVPEHAIWKGSWARTKAFLFQPSTTWLGPSWPVSGPFKVQSSSSTSIQLIRNPDWSILSPPPFASVTIDSYASDNSLLAAAEDGKVDLAQGFGTTDLAKGIISAGSLPRGLALRFYPTGGIEHLEPNLLATPPRGEAVSPLANVKVRQALNLAIDRQTLVEKSLNIPPGQTANLIAYGPEMPGRFDGLAVPGVWDPIKRRYVTTPQPADALKLLSEAGWRLDGTMLRRTGCTKSGSACKLQLLMLVPRAYQQRIQESKYLQTVWGHRNSYDPQGLGVHTVLNFREWSIGNMIAPYRERGACARGWFDFCLFAELPGYDPQTDFQLEFTSNHIARIKKHPAETDLNYPGIQDPRLDRIFAQAATTYDLQTRRELNREWQIIVAKQAYWIPLYQQPLIVIEHAQVRNFDPTVRGAEWNPWALAPA